MVEELVNGVRVTAIYTLYRDWVLFNGSVI